MGWVVNDTPWPLYSRERGPVAMVKEAGWAPGPVWTGAEELALAGIRSSDRPAPSNSLYRLSHPGPPKNGGNIHQITLRHFSQVMKTEATLYQYTAY